MDPAQFRMTNLFAKFATLGIIAAGFAFTGDLGWLARRGMDVIQAADVAADRPLEPQAATRPQPPAAPTDLTPPRPAIAPQPAAVVLLSAAEDQSNRDVKAAEQPAITATALQPPTAGPATVSWASLAAGDRLVLWFGPATARCLVLDIVDPASGAAVAYEAASISREGRPLTASAPPRRVIVGRPPQRVPGTSLERGGLVHVADVGIAATGEGRWLGPITAIAVID